MRAMALGVLLTAGLCCMLACFGIGEDEAKDAQAPAAQGGVVAGEQPKQVQVDPRHQRRINAMNGDGPAEGQGANAEEDPLVNLSHDVILGDLPNAKEASEYFVTKFVQEKQKTNVRFVAPEGLMKYNKDSQEWRAYGTMTSEDRRQGYQVECYVKFHEPNEWECRRIQVNGKRSYSSQRASNAVELPNLKVGDNGRLQLEATDTAETADADNAVSEADEKAASGKLKIARVMLNRNPENAKQRLQEVIDKYPDTASAVEAEDLLSKMKKPTDPPPADATE